MSLAWAAPATDALLERGEEALRAKDGSTAREALQACVTEAPTHTACWWELGWAGWLLGDWAAVVAAWEQVERLDPAHADLARHLATARDNLALQERIRVAAASAPAPVAGPSSGQVKLRLRAVGDVMLGTDYPAGLLPPNDGAGLLADVQGWLTDAHLTFANMEGPLCDGGTTDKCGKGGGPCYAFRTPTRYGALVKDAGVDVVSLANNHANDFGDLCLRQTEATMDALGIAWSGRPGSVASVVANGLEVALVAFHTSRTSNYLNDHATAAALVRSAAASHDVVIVSFHGGAEGAKAQHVPAGSEAFYGEDRGDLRRFARVVVEAGADLVIGHGPHVLRGMEVVEGRLVAYSLGNFATYGPFNLSGPNGVGAVLEVQLDEAGRFLGGRIFPTRQVGEGVPQKDPAAEAVDLVRLLTASDFPQTGVVVASDGTLSAPR